MQQRYFRPDGTEIQYDGTMDNVQRLLHLLAQKFGIEEASTPTAAERAKIRAGKKGSDLQEIQERANKIESENIPPPTPTPGPQYDGKAPDKMQKTMHEFKEGSLHSGSKKGPKVTNRKQAIAIGLSQARKAGQDAPPAPQMMMDGSCYDGVAKEAKAEHETVAHERREMKEGDKDDAKHDGGKWIQGAIKHPGALHKQLGVPQGKKIPAGRLAKAAKAGGTLGRRARLAQTLKGMHK